MCCEADVLAHTLDIFHSRSYKQTAEPLEMEQWRQACLSLCLVGLCSLALYLYYVAWWRPQSLRNKLRRQGITGPPPSLLYGNAMEIKSLMAEKSRGGGGREVKHGFTPAMFPHLEQWKKVYGPVFCYSLGNLVVLHISHPELVKEINLCSSLDLGKTPHLRKTHEPLFGQGILKSSGEVWSHQRKIIAPEFYADKVKGMVDLMIDAATPLLQSWKEKVRLQGGTADMNIDEDLRSYSADVLSRTCFGSNYNRGKEIFTKIRELQKAVSRPNLLAEIVGLRCLPTKRAQEAWRMNREINSLILRTVKEGGNGGEEGRGPRGSSKQSLLQAILRNAGNELTYTDPDSFIVDNCKNMYFAGHETTALTSSWCLMLLALHPEWQARARAEVAEVCADGRPPDAKSIQKMKILTMVIQETLRLYPVGAYVARELRREMEFGGIRIPKGVNIFVQIAALHHDPSIWGPDVLEFNPERFAGGVLGACRFPHAYLPFGLGPRTCLGQHFAMVELKVLLALLLRSFSFSLSPNYRHSPALRLIVEPEFGVDLLVTEL